MRTVAGVIVGILLGLGLSLALTPVSAQGTRIAGVRGVYDRHAYVAEKRDALERLSALLERILSQAEANVISIRAARAR